LIGGTCIYFFVSATDLKLVAAALTASACALIFVGAILFSNEISAGTSFILWVCACFTFGFAGLNGLRGLKAQNKPKAAGLLLVVALLLGLTAMALPRWFVAVQEVGVACAFAKHPSSSFRLQHLGLGYF